MSTVLSFWTEFMLHFKIRQSKSLDISNNNNFSSLKHDSNICLPVPAVFRQALVRQETTLLSPQNHSLCCLQTCHNNQILTSIHSMHISANGHVMQSASSRSMALSTQTRLSHTHTQTILTAIFQVNLG